MISRQSRTVITSLKGRHEVNQAARLMESIQNFIKSRSRKYIEVTLKFGTNNSNSNAIADLLHVYRRS